MATTGIEGVLVANVLGPVIKSLVTSASESMKAMAFKKWSTKGFERKLTQKLASASKVKTIWSPEKETSLLVFYYPSKIAKGGHALGGAEQVAVDSLSDIGRQNVVIQGTVGQGKSIFLRYLAVQELSEKGTSRIPVLIELRTVTAKKDVRHHIKDALEKLDLKADDSVFDYLANSGKIVLLLDGFDELEQDVIADTLSAIEFLAEKYSSLQIVITSRPQNGIQNSRLFDVQTLCGLAPSDFSGFLSKMGIKSVRNAEIVQAISHSSNDIKSIITTPLMLTLLVLVYQSEKKIPAEFSDFFEVLFHTVFTKHDSLKTSFQRQHYSGLSEKKLELLFESFCFMVMQNGFGRTLNSDQFYWAFSRALEYADNCNCEAESFKKDITKVSCLMLEEGFNLVTFLHKSIMEYFSASFIKHCADPSAKRFYEKVRDDAAPWKQVLAFLSVIDKYRFELNFAAPNIEKFFSMIGSHPEKVAGESDSEINRILITYCSSIEIGYHQDDKSTVPYLSSISGSLFDSRGTYTGLILDGLSDAVLSGVVRTHISDTTLIAAISSGAFSESKGAAFSLFTIKLMPFIKEFGATEIVEQVQIYLNSLRRDWHTVQNMMKREEKKSLIFESKEGRWP